MSLHLQIILCSITSAKKTHFIPIKSNVGLTFMELIGIIMFPHPKTAGLIKLWNGLGQLLWTIWKVLQRARMMFFKMYVLNQL